MKKTVIRLLSVCIVLLLTGSILVGCSGKTESSSGGASTEPVNNASAEPSNTSDSKASDAPVTIQYWFQGTDEATVSEVNTIIEMFNEKYPNIKVEATGMSPTISDQETKLNAAVLSDTYPDVIQLVLAEVGSRGALNDFEPLEPYIEKWENKDDVFESAYEMGKYAGVQVAIGCAPNPQVFVYRKDLFEKAGLDPNTPPKTWAELANAAEKLTERDAQGNVTIAGLDIPAIDTSLVFTEPFMRSAGSKVIDELNIKPSFTDENAARALQYIADLAQKNVSIPHDFQNSDEKPFMNLRGAISNVNGGAVKVFKKNHPEYADKLGYFSHVSEDGVKDIVPFCGYQLYAMGATSKHKDAAWTFISFLMSKDVIEYRGELKSYPPVLKSLESSFVEKDPELNACLMEVVKKGKGKATVPWVSVYNKYVSTAYEEAINGKKTAEQALKDAETALLKDIAQ